MIIYPAMDLRAGRVVRLRQGRAEDETIYSDNPAEVAARWQADGAEWLHVVDLDRALGAADSPNRGALRSILAAVRIPVQFGGGLRDEAGIREPLELGAARVVVGTLAVEQADEFAEIAVRVGAERIVVAADVRDGFIATRGWQAVSGLTLAEFGRRVREIGVRLALVTDIARDGMLSGVDAEAYARAARDTGLSIIASGGVASLDDLRALAAFQPAGVEGAIVGRALYTGAITLSDALRIQGIPGRGGFPWTTQGRQTRPYGPEEAGGGG